MVVTIWARALDALEDRGWGQGWALGLDGCLCVGGAISYAYCGDPAMMYYSDSDLNDLLTRFADHVGAETFHDERADEEFSPAQRVYLWNDAGKNGLPGPKRTFEEVKKVLLELDELERNDSDA